MIQKYNWKPFSNFKIPAQVAGERLETIRKNNGGDLRAADIVKDASSLKSPLHSLFDWDDTEAACKWRLRQAEVLRRAVTVVIIRSSKPTSRPVRAFVSVKKGDGNVFTSTTTAMRNQGQRAQIVNRAMKELIDWRKRYEDLKEFSEIFILIDDLKLEKTA